MTAALRLYKEPRKKPRFFRDPYRGLAKIRDNETDPEKRRKPVLPIPDPITFAISPEWLDRTLYPKQVTLLKCVFLRTEMLTNYDHRVIKEWEDSFRLTGENGTPVDLVARMYQLKDEGHIWFKELVLVLGRRAGKGYICAIAMAYVLWHYIALWDPQKVHEIDPDKRLEVLIYAGRKEQARDNLWRDLYNVLTKAPCYEEFIAKPMGESLSIRTPHDLERREQAQKSGRRFRRDEGIDDATIRIIPLPATPMSGRGGASCILGFDEMGHMVATGANRSSDEVWVAATPSLDQFGKYGFIVCPSSPWEMTGRFYVEWQHSFEIDEETGGYLYPEIFMLQLASWEIYEDWEIADQIEIFPPAFVEYENESYYEWDPKDLPRLGKFTKPVTEFDQSMERLERADPDMFAVERRSHWQATMDAYLNKDHIAAMFSAERQKELFGAALTMTTVGTLNRFYKGHGDPGFVNDPFGISVAHVLPDDDGYLHVIFDYIEQWVPATFKNHTIDYIWAQEKIWELIKGFPIDDFSFDQHQSTGMTAELMNRIRTHPMPKRPVVHVINETAAYNLKVAETFKVALNQGWLHAPQFEPAQQELLFLQFKNGKVTHQTTGPVQHDDVARSMMEVVFALLERQVAQYLLGEAPVVFGLEGGARPWGHPSGAEKEVLNQFAVQRTGRNGRGQGYSPARGRPPGISGPGRGGRRPGRM